MDYDLLLRSGHINAMPMRNRLITGPMERSLARRDGSLGQAYVDYVTERARGGASLIVLESTYVDTRGMGDPFQVGCHADHVVPGLRRAADAVHAEGAKLGLELYFGGRVTPSRVSQRQPLAPSAVPCAALDPVPAPREMTRAEIAEITCAFADAARRAVAGGVDMIHLHGAHGYLLCAFLSPRTNLRRDEYGGSLENRARFALEVLAAVREVVGPAYPIGYRLSADEYVPGGLTVDESAAFAVLLADAGIDLVDVSGGTYESVTRIVQGADAPRGAFVRHAQVIKAAVGDRVPVSVAQRLDDPELANEILASGIDFVTLSRAFHADPQYARKLAEHRLDDIVPCIGCQRCSELLAANQQARCATNPATGLERRRRLPGATRARRVVVVGGGPGGMQAARLLAEQGHTVVLYERRAALGGQVSYSSRILPDYGRLSSFLAGQIAKLGVEVRLGVEADMDSIDGDEPEAVVFATGAAGGPHLWPLEGEPRTFDLFTALERGDEEWNEHVVIVGGDTDSCRLGLHLARFGASVQIVDPGRELADDRGGPARLALIEALERHPNVQLRPETTVEMLGEGYVVVQSGGRHARIDGLESVVIGGRAADDGLFEQYGRRRPDLEVHAVGDAVRPRDIYAASHEAADAAERIHLRAIG